MKCILTFILVIFTGSIFAQRSNPDSFLLALYSQKTESLQTQTILDWMDVELFLQSDSMGYYGTRIIEYGTKQKNENVKALGYTFVGYHFLIHDEKAQGLELAFKALQIAEKSDNKKMIGRVYHFLSFFYDDDRAIAYDQQSLLLSEQANDLLWMGSALYTIGRKYASMAKYDSALFYAQRASTMNNHLLITAEEKEFIGLHIYALFGNIYSRLKNNTLTQAYYQLSLESALKIGSDIALSYPYTGLAAYHLKMKNRDSAYFYGRALYTISERNPISWKLYPSRILYRVFKESNQADSALKYLEINTNAKDSINVISKRQKIETLQFAEEIRQKELLIAKAKLKDERKQNLQYAGIALGLVLFILLFFLFSHSIIANQKIIRFLGVIALLIVFEFLNLFLHPYLDKLTDHSPILMLAAMVCIAALLVPLHHKLEHWITNRMVEKNKKIRLAAAKKTIAKLEPGSN
ncbi:MAG TPA: hypothetical protein VK498_02635 [Ferruginibacter sp.]|nr:hypothetical protein [Ferruginibacter sp.]